MKVHCASNQNQSINIGGRAMIIFSKNSNHDLDLQPTILKWEIVQDVILNICVEIHQTRGTLGPDRSPEPCDCRDMNFLVILFPM